MNKTPIRRPENPYQSPMRKLRVGKVAFEIDEEGQVSTKECGALGHEEECIRRGEALMALLKTLEKVEANLSEDKK